MNRRESTSRGYKHEGTFTSNTCKKNVIDNLASNNGNVQSTPVEMVAITYRYVSCFMLPIVLLRKPERKLFPASLRIRELTEWG